VTVTSVPVALGPTRGRPEPAGRGPELLPLEPGQQYRFTFAMDACVGCHSCEVACAEQNATALDEPWRRVGEIEAGQYPTTRRFNLSMACNHCIEPTCLSGCPTNAYEKLANGIVTHHAEECVGCQYCIWNCPYEVPVYSAARKVVSKCDLCKPRLEAGQEPACVLACPTRAIGVEPVDVASWRADHAAADAPGLPPSAITLSTTAIRVPPGLGGEVRTGDDHRVEPEDPHWPLIALTLLTQLALGAVAATTLLDAVGTTGPAAGGAGALGGAATAAFVAGSAALSASLLHLGRPARALKALRNLRTSWLSREVALFVAFAAAALAYAASSHLGLAHPVRLGVGVAATAAGAAGVYASARLYLVPARPVWNSLRTPVSFAATAVAAGPLLALLAVDRSAAPAGAVAALVAAAAAGTLLQLACHLHLVRALRRAGDRQHRGTAELLGRRRDLVLARLGLAGLALALLASVVPTGLDGPAAGGRLAAALLAVAAGELAGRYLFYVTVVPYRVAGSFFGR